MSTTVTRAIDILRLIAARPRSLVEIAELLDIHRSTAFRMLQTLEEADLARRQGDGRFVVGLGAVPLAESALSRFDIRTIARPYLERLAAELGHTVHLAQEVNGRVIYVDKVEGAGVVAMGSRIGLPAEIHTAAVAKVIVASLSEADRAPIIERCEFRQYGPTTIASPAAFRRELRRVREQGWAEDDGEKEDYINCVALPIKDATGRTTTGLSITALKAVAPLDSLRAEIPRIRHTADAISAELGWRGSEPVGRRSLEQRVIPPVTEGL